MSETERISRWIVKTYGNFIISEDDFEELYLKMTKDKKNEAGRINFTLIPQVGKVEINIDCDKELVLEGLNFFRKLQ